MKKTFFRIAGLLVVAAAGWGGYRLVKELPDRQEQLPTSKMQRSDVIIRAYSPRGMRAVGDLTLEQAKKALAQLQSDIQSRYEQGEAQLAVLQEQRNRNLIQVRQETQRLQQTKQLSPIEGLVSIRQNRTGNVNFGQTPPDIR